jgi:hypothetical protein
VAGAGAAAFTAAAAATLGGAALPGCFSRLGPGVVAAGELAGSPGWTAASSDLAGSGEG